MQIHTFFKPVYQTWSLAVISSSLPEVSRHYSVLVTILKLLNVSTFTVPVHIFIKSTLPKKVKVKSKVHPVTRHEGPEMEWKYSSICSLTSVLDGGRRLMPHLSQFTPGKETQHTSYRRLGGAQGQSGWVQTISPPPGFDPLTVQPIASCNSDYAIPVPQSYHNHY